MATDESQQLMQWLYSWLESVKLKVSEYTQIIIVGNKSDLVVDDKTPQAQVFVSRRADTANR